MIFFESFQIVIQLFLAAFLGSLIDLEREFKRKEAGFTLLIFAGLGLLEEKIVKK